MHNLHLIQMLGNLHLGLHLHLIRLLHFPLDMRQPASEHKPDVCAELNKIRNERIGKGTTKVRKIAKKSPGKEVEVIWHAIPIGM